MKINGEFILREIAGDIILVPVGETALNMNGMITLDPVAALIWKGIDSGLSREEILEGILAEYDVEREEAGEDMESFISQMREENLIIE